MIGAHAAHTDRAESNVMGWVLISFQLLSYNMPNISEKRAPDRNKNVEMINFTMIPRADNEQKTQSCIPH